MAPQLAWIGLGNIGRGMVKNLYGQGPDECKNIIVYNRTISKAQSLNLGTVASSISDAVSKSDIIFTCVGDDKAMLETITEALKSDVKGKLFVDCSTIHPDTTDKLDKMIQDAGAGLIAMPVFGAPAMADSGNLVCVPSGPSDLIDKILPYTKAVGKANIPFRDAPPSKALLLKIVGNTFILSMVETLSEGHALAEKSGLGVEALQMFLENIFPAPYLAYSKRMQSGDYYQRDEPLFAVDLARKDAGHALDLAKTYGVKMKGVEVCDDHLKAVKEEMGSKGDIAGIYGAVRKESGMSFGNQ